MSHFPQFPAVGLPFPAFFSDRPLSFAADGPGLSADPRSSGITLLRRLSLSLLILLLVAKVIGVVMRGPSPLVMDARQYWELGGEVLGGDWLLRNRPIAFRTPAYPWLVGLVRGVSPFPLGTLVCFQAGLWIASVFLTMRLSRLITGHQTAGWFILSVAVVMVSSVTYVSAVLTETLFVFLLMLHLCCFAHFVRKPTIRWGAAVGLTLALATLTRPIAQLVWVADLIYLLASWRWPAVASIGETDEHGFTSRTALRPTLLPGALAIAVMLICLVPWLMRNEAMFGKVMLTEFVGRNIWIVTFAGESGAELPLPHSPSAEKLTEQLGDREWKALQTADRWRNTWTMSHALTGSGLDDAATDRLMKSVALAAIGENPSAFARKAGRRAVNFWRTRATELPPQYVDVIASDPAGLDGEAPPTESHPPYAQQSVWGVKVAPVDTALRYRWSNWLAGNTFLMLLTAGSTMLLIVRPQTRAAGLWLAAVLAYFSLVTALLEVPGYRYRMIVEPVMLLIVAIAVTCLIPTSASPPRQPSSNE